MDWNYSIQPAEDAQKDLARARIAHNTPLAAGHNKQVYEGIRNDILKVMDADRQEVDVAEALENIEGVDVVPETDMDIHDVPIDAYDGEAYVIHQERVPIEFGGAFAYWGAEKAVQETVSAWEKFLETGYIHEDPKPANVRFRTDGTACFVDFLDDDALEEDVEDEAYHVARTLDFMGRKISERTSTPEDEICNYVIGTSSILEETGARKPLERYRRGFVEAGGELF